MTTSKIVSNKIHTPSFKKQDLVVYQDSDLVVLVTADSKGSTFSGVVLVSGDKWPVAHLSDLWGLESFNYFNGTIELKS